MFRAALILAAVALALPAQAQPASDDGNVHIDETANGRTVRLRPGQRLVLTVETCHGCSWSLTLLPTNLVLLGIDRTSNDPPGDPANPETLIVGGSSTTEFWLGAQRAGRGALAFTYGPFTRGGRGGRALRVDVITN